MRRGSSWLTSWTWCWDRDLRRSRIWDLIVCWQSLLEAVGSAELVEQQSRKTGWTETRIRWAKTLTAQSWLLPFYKQICTETDWDLIVCWQSLLAAVNLDAAFWAILVIWRPSHLGAILVKLGQQSGAFGLDFGHLGTILGHLGQQKGYLGTCLGHLGAILGPSWTAGRPSWSHFGDILEPSWAIWRHIRAMLEPS